MHHAVAGVVHVPVAARTGYMTGSSLDIAPLGEELRFLLHLLHLLEGAVGVDEAGDGDTLVVLVAHHVLDALELLELLLHLLLTLLAAHGDAKLEDWQVAAGSLRVDGLGSGIVAAVGHGLLVVARVVHWLPVKQLRWKPCSLARRNQELN